jgi:hypothetical protein
MNLAADNIVFTLFHPFSMFVDKYTYTYIHIYKRMTLNFDTEHNFLRGTDVQDF